MGIYSRLNNNGKKIFYIDYYFHGKRIRESIGHNRKEAEDALAARKTDIRRGEYRFQKDHKIFFSDFALEYLKYAKINKKSWKRDQICIKNLLPYLGDLLLSRIAPSDIEAYKEDRLKKISPSTINRELACLRYMFTVAEQLGKFEGKNPVKEVKFLQSRQYVFKVLTAKEIKRLIDAAVEHLKPIIILALNTGMRRGELFNLRWSDVHFKDRFLFIKETKSNIMRKIPMNDLVIKTIKSIEKKSEFVFTSPRSGTRFRDIQYSFKRACEKAEINDCRFHDTRHTAATHMIQRGADIVTVSQILGHTDIKMTLKYCHPSDDSRLRAVDLLSLSFKEPAEEIYSHNKDTSLN